MRQRWKKSGLSSRNSAGPLGRGSTLSSLDLEDGTIEQTALLEHTGGSGFDATALTIFVHSDGDRVEVDVDSIHEGPFEEGDTVTVDLSGESEWYALDLIHEEYHSLGFAELDVED